MGKNDPSCSKRYNRIKNVLPKKDQGKRKQGATNNVAVNAEEPVSKPKYRKCISQYTKAVREFGERRSEFESKDTRGTNCKRACITKGRLTIPQMGLFMRSQMSQVAVRGGNGHLNEMNEARLNDDLQQIIRLANTNGNEAHPLKEGFTTLREQANIVTISLESDDESEVVDNPPTPRSEVEPCTFQKRLGANQQEIDPPKEMGPKRFLPKVTSTAQIGQPCRTPARRAPAKRAPAPRRRLPFPRAAKARVDTPSPPPPPPPTDSEGEELPPATATPAEDDPNCSHGRKARLPEGCDSLNELFRTFATGYVRDVHKVYRQFIDNEGYSSIQQTRQELTASFRKTCAKVLTDEGKSVDEENILNLTLQICGPDKYTSPKPGTVSSLRDYKQRNKELFPDTDSEDEAESNASDPLSIVAEPPPPSRMVDSNLFKLEIGRRAVGGEEERREGEDQEVFCYSPEFQRERIVTTLDPIRFIQQTLGRFESGGRERRPSVFEAVTPVCRQGCPDPFQRSHRRPAETPPPVFHAPTPRPRPRPRTYAGRPRPRADPPKLPFTRYRLSSDRDVDCCDRRRQMASSPLTVHFGEGEGRGRAVGGWGHHSATQDTSPTDEDKQLFMKLDCQMDEVKPRYVSPEQRFYQLCMF